MLFRSRYFTDAIPKGKEYDYSLPAVQGVQFCSKLFDCERYSKAKNHTAEQRKQFRLEKEKPILEAFWNWLDQQRPNKGTRLAKAVNYAQNRKDTLMPYLEDGHCSLSNNLSENAIRPFTVGRKNWLFSASPKGAASSAIVYTMGKFSFLWKEGTCKIGNVRKKRCRRHAVCWRTEKRAAAFF